MIINIYIYTVYYTYVYIYICVCAWIYAISWLSRLSLTFWILQAVAEEENHGSKTCRFPGFWHRSTQHATDLRGVESRALVIQWDLHTYSAWNTVFYRDVHFCACIALKTWERGVKRQYEQQTQQRCVFRSIWTDYVLGIGIAFPLGLKNTQET